MTDKPNNRHKFPKRLGGAMQSYTIRLPAEIVAKLRGGSRKESADKASAARAALTAIANSGPVPPDFKPI